MNKFLIAGTKNLNDEKISKAFEIAKAYFDEGAIVETYDLLVDILAAFDVFMETYE